ncbi:hypothetical protein [Haliea sp. E17]|uniref:hypothetical protein n=1 Tax=Haliea sp. E17 TaxID=3401576 RepID=UPI003AADE313
MIITTATACTGETGPLTRTVIDYCTVLEGLVSGGAVSTADWDVLRDYVAVEEFCRVGAYLETMNWAEYIDFLTQWAGGTRFETTIFRIAEIGDSVYQEIEERHYRGEEFIRKNVVAVYRFDPAGRIRHLDIYEQARDSGQWIIDAAKTSTEA